MLKECIKILLQMLLIVKDMIPYAQENTNAVIEFEEKAKEINNILEEI